ncbi:MAG: hypothetical protein Q7R65_00615 [bacterium]|nr:hypothetical protein [bacterium]
MKDYKKLNPNLQRGQALITAVVFFLIIATTLSMAVLNPVLRQVKQVGDFARTRGSLFTSQSVNEDALYRLRNNMKFVSPSTLSLNGYSATATSTVIVGGIQIDSSGSGFGLIRNIQTHLTSGNGTSFNYGVQVGDGGLILENSSSVSGNVYSNGPITGSGNNLIRGDAVSAKTTGRVSGVHATSSVYANTIQNSTIDKDAYYQTISGSTVGGTSYPGSPDQATSTFPVSDAQIADWESDAAAGGTISSPCPYIIISDTTIGPKKINCDLEISGDPTVTLSGALWVVGSVTIKNTAIMAVSPSLSGKSVAIIADNPANRTTDSKISLENSAVFQGSGAGSYVLFVSQNNSAEQGGGEKAVNTNNSVDGDLLVYAGHGEIQLQNSINVKEVTAYRIRLKNSAEVIYETGLANLLFTSGPSGGYVFDKWREVQ